MDTIIAKVTEQGESISKAADILRVGGLVAFPTETVYGLGGDGLNKEASGKIYAAKGRPSDNPLIIHIGEQAALDNLVRSVSEPAKKLMDAFWPGPMTLIFDKSDRVPKETTGGLDTVAIRYPSHPVALRLLRESGVYIAAPSANLSGRPSPTHARHVIEDLNGRIDMILDGGAVEIGLESTIIDVTGMHPVILRPGFITKEMIEQLLPDITVDPAILVEQKQEKLVAKAPGMKYKHYAPRGQLYLVEGTNEKAVFDKINAMVEEAADKGLRAAVIATEESANNYQTGLVKVMGSRLKEETVAKKLFAILREMDDLGVDVIYSESFGQQGLGQAIMNRLLKAAGYQIISADES